MKMILSIFGYIHAIGILGYGIVICKIQTETMLSKKDTRLINVISEDQQLTAILCINQCLLYEPQCRAASFSKINKRCVLHSEHPLSTNAQLMTAAGFSLHYSLHEECDSGWERFGWRCYKFVTNKLSWAQADVSCKNLGANLLKVDEEAEDIFAREKCTEYGRSFYWIGARFLDQFNEHRWYDGTIISYTNGWAPGQPQTAGGCVDMLGKWGYLWNDHWDCFTTYGGSICEKGLFD